MINMLINTTEHKQRADPNWSKGMWCRIQNTVCNSVLDFIWLQQNTVFNSVLDFIWLQQNAVFNSVLDFIWLQQNTVFNSVLDFITVELSEHDIFYLLQCGVDLTEFLWWTACVDVLCGRAVCEKQRRHRGNCDCYQPSMLDSRCSTPGHIRARHHSVMFHQQIKKLV